MIVGEIKRGGGGWCRCLVAFQTADGAQFAEVTWQPSSRHDATWPPVWPDAYGDLIVVGMRPVENVHIEGINPKAFGDRTGKTR